MKQLTIFTPTFNRKHTLPRLYESLCMQDCLDFIWLIVDDGSNDDTKELVSQWINNGKIDICYYKQQNGGKMRAHNRGVKECQTELFMCLDSDDMLNSSTVITDNLRFWNNHSVSTRSDISGMVSYRKMTNGPFSPFPDIEFTTLSELHNAGFKGETTLVFKTKVLKEYLFPEIEGEKFITEAYIYDQLDIHYKMLVFPYFSQICEYQKDGYTNNYLQVLLNNPKGYQMYFNQLIKLKKNGRFYHTKMYIATSLLANDKNMFWKASNKILFLLLFPLGYLQYQNFQNGKW